MHKPLTYCAVAADNLCMSIDGGNTSVARWRRYGKDRLYVTAGEDIKVGYWDLVTGQGHPESPEHEDALVAAVKEWRAEQGMGEPDAPVHPSEPTPAVAVVPSAPLAVAPEHPVGLLREGTRLLRSREARQREPRRQQNRTQVTPFVARSAVSTGRAI